MEMPPVCPCQSVAYYLGGRYQWKQELGSFCTLRSFPSLGEKIHASWYSKTVAMNCTKKISCDILRSTQDDGWRMGMEGRQLAVVTDFRDEENGTFTLKENSIKIKQ